jgi:acetyltransferase
VIAIRALDPQEARRRQGELVAVLRDAVESGASVGFVLPFAPAEPEVYWQSVAEAIGTGRRKLLVALLDERIVGAVQLDLEPRANGRHRAEVMKLMVLRAHRRHGVGRQLMRAALDLAPAVGRSLLLLDVRSGDPAEALYRSLGFVKFGEVPGHARSPDGRLAPTSFHYLDLGYSPGQ